MSPPPPSPTPPEPASQPPLSRAARIAIAALGLCGLVGGWIVVLGGGFHHAPHRYSRETTFVDGPSAVLMAAIQFTLAAVCVAALLQQRGARWPAQVLGCGAVLVPPLVVALMQS